MTEQQPIQLQMQDPNEAVMLLGISDANLKLIEEAFQIQMITRGDSIVIVGEEENKQHASQLVQQLLKVIRKGININQRDVVSALEMSKTGTINILRSSMMKLLRGIQKEKLYEQKQ